MSLWQKLVGTTESFFRLGFAGPRLKDSSGSLVVRNPGDSADSGVIALKVSVSGDDIDINSDAAGSGADWKYTLRRPSSGMASAIVLTLPVNDGSNGEALVTDGSGNLSFSPVSGGGSKSLMAQFVSTYSAPSTGTLRWYPPANCTLSNAVLFGATPSENVSADILKNGTSIFAGSGYPALTTAQNKGTDVTLNTSLTPTDYLTINLLSGRGSDLVLRLDYS